MSFLFISRLFSEIGCIRIRGSVPVKSVVPQWPRFECFQTTSVDGLQGALVNLRQ